MYKHQKSMFSLDIFYIGNAGGYLGLFLGYTLLNVPDFLKDTYNRIIDKYKEIRDLCYHSIDKKETIVPVLLNQAEAMHVCKIMGSKMTYNKTLSEYDGIIF